MSNKRIENLNVISVITLVITILSTFFTFLILSSSHAIDESFRYRIAMISIVSAFFTSFLLIWTEYLDGELLQLNKSDKLIIVISMLLGIIYEYFLPFTVIIIEYILFSSNESHLSIIVSRILDFLM